MSNLRKRLQEEYNVFADSHNNYGNYSDYTRAISDYGAGEVKAAEDRRLKYMSDDEITSYFGGAMDKAVNLRNESQKYKAVLDEYDRKYAGDASSVRNKAFQTRYGYSYDELQDNLTSNIAYLDNVIAALEQEAGFRRDSGLKNQRDYAIAVMSDEELSAIRRDAALDNGMGFIDESGKYNPNKYAAYGVTPENATEYLDYAYLNRKFYPTAQDMSRDEIQALYNKLTQNLERYDEATSVSGTFIRGDGATRAGEAKRAIENMTEEYGITFNNARQIQSILKATLDEDDETLRQARAVGANDPVISVFGGGILNAIGNTAGSIDKFAAKILGTPSTAGTGLNRLADIGGAVQRGATERMKTEFGKSASTVWNSIANSVGNILVGSVLGGVGGLDEASTEALTLAGFFGSSQNQVYNDSIAKGYSEEDAMALSTIAGAVEVVTEKVSLDNIIAMANGAEMKDMIYNIVRQSVTEMSEEGASEIANIIAEAIILGRAEGWSNEDIKGSIAELAARVVESAGSGAVSGAVFGAGGTVIGSVSNFISEAKSSVAKKKAQGATYDEIRSEYQKAFVQIDGQISSELQAMSEVLKDLDTNSEAQMRTAAQALSRLAEWEQQLNTLEADTDPSASGLYYQYFNNTYNAVEYFKEGFQSVLENYDQQNMGETQTKAPAETVKTDVGRLASPVERVSTPARSTEAPKAVSPYNARISGNTIAQVAADNNADLLGKFADGLGLGSEGKKGLTSLYSGQNAKLSTSEYAAAYTAYYNAGKNGLDKASVKTKGVLDAYTRDYAYNTGLLDNINSLSTKANNSIKEKEENGRNVSVYAGGERNDGKGSALETRSVERSAEKAEAGKRKVALQTLNYAKDKEVKNVEYDDKPVTAKSEGIKSGDGSSRVYLVTGNETTAMASKRSEAEKHGYKVKYFVGGNMSVGGVKVNGLVSYDNGVIYARADDMNITPEQIVEHELAHDRVKKGEIDLTAEVKRVKEVAGADAFTQILDAYAQAYGGERLSDAEIFEEIVCDAYAGINIFEPKGITENVELFGKIKDVIRTPAGQITERAANAPPTDALVKAEYVAIDALAKEGHKPVLLKDGNDVYIGTNILLFKADKAQANIFRETYTPDIRSGNFAFNTVRGEKVVSEARKVYNATTKKGETAIRIGDTIYGINQKSFNFMNRSGYHIERNSDREYLFTVIDDSGNFIAGFSVNKVKDVNWEELPVIETRIDLGIEKKARDKKTDLTPEEKLIAEEYKLAKETDDGYHTIAAYDGNTPYFGSGIILFNASAETVKDFAKQNNVEIKNVNMHLDKARGSVVTSGARAGAGYNGKSINYIHVDSKAPRFVKVNNTLAIDNNIFKFIDKPGYHLEYNPEGYFFTVFDKSNNPIAVFAPITAPGVVWDALTPIETKINLTTETKINLTTAKAVTEKAEVPNTVEKEAKTATVKEKTAKPAKAEKTEEIKDFGQKIGGAKKDLWRSRGLTISDLEEMNAAERSKYIKKDNVWTKVDYQTYVDNGATKEVAYYIKTLRDALPVSPQFKYKETENPETVAEREKDYIEFVRMVRDAVSDIKTREDAAGLFNKLFVETGYYNPTANSGSKWTEKSRANIQITSKFIEAVRNANSAYSWEYDVVKKMNKAQFLVAEDQKIPAGFSVELYDGNGWTNKGNEWKVGTYYITKGYSIVAVNFETKEAAISWLKEKVAGAKTGGKKRFTPPQLEFVRRTGRDVRSGNTVNIAGDEYINTFGFRGGEFGNWLNQQDRQFSLNYGYDALTDLADVLNIEYSDISFGGKLAIAFGARGQGAAAAHYEPERAVINLTKMNGAGSLAHEWAHALDDIIGTRLLGGKKGYFTENATKLKIPVVSKLIDDMKWKTGTEEQSNKAKEAAINRYRENLKSWIVYEFQSLINQNKLTNEQKARYESLKESLLSGKTDYHGFTGGDIAALSALKKEVSGHVIEKKNVEKMSILAGLLYSEVHRESSGIRVKTDFYRQSQLIGDLYGKEMGAGYWDSNIEMFARAFACYVKDKLDARQMQSDYLNAHSESAVAITFENDDVNKPVLVEAFPKGEERKVLDADFDALFDYLKENGYLAENKSRIASYSNVSYQEGEAKLSRATFEESDDPVVREFVEGVPEKSRATDGDEFSRALNTEEVNGTLRGVVDIGKAKIATKADVAATAAELKRFHGANIATEKLTSALGDVFDAIAYGDGTDGEGYLDYVRATADEVSTLLVDNAELPYDESERDGAIEDATNQIIRLALDVEFAHLGKLYTEEIAKARQKVKEARSKIRQQVIEIKNQQIDKIREKNAARMAEYKQKVADQKLKAREQRNASALRGKIGEHVAELQHKVEHNTVKNHIPEKFREATIDLLKAINGESEYVYEYTPEGEIKRVKRSEASQPGAEETRKTLNERERQMALDRLSNVLDTKRGEGEALAEQGLITTHLTGMGENDIGLLDRMKDLNGKPLYSMTVEELSVVYDTIRGLEAAISSYNKTFSAFRGEKISTIAGNLYWDNIGKKAPKFDGKVRKDILGELTPQTFFHTYGQGGVKIWNALRSSQDKFTLFIEKAQNDTQAKLKELGLTQKDVRDLEKKRHKVKFGGKEIELTMAELIDLYLSYRREGTTKTYHLTKGGFEYQHDINLGVKKVKKQRVVVSPDNPEDNPFKETDYARAFAILTDNESVLAFAEWMSNYLSTTVAEWGNAATMEVYGFERFRDANYWRFDVSEETTVEKGESSPGVVLTPAGAGFTNEIKKGAANRLVIGNAVEKFTDHIRQMANYAAWLPVTEDMMRIKNHKTVYNKYVKDILVDVHGKSALAYWNDLMSDISNGQMKDDYGAFLNLVGAFKTAAVGANLRVIAQQPTAIWRASWVIPTRNLIATKPASFVQAKAAWNRAKKYSPIALWKSWGYYDVTTGKTVSELLFGSNAYETAKQKLLEPAGWADAYGWGWLWLAAEKTVADKYAKAHPDKNDAFYTSDEFYGEVKKIFEECVDKTQVVDGVLQRNGLMRSKRDLVKMATVFGGEPAKIVNMAYQAVYDKNGKNLARCSFALLISMTINAAVQSLIDALRDDDIDEKYGEKYLEALVGDYKDAEGIWDAASAFLNSNLGDAVNPLAYIPFLKDVASIMRGYSVDRMDIEIVSDIVTAMQRAESGKYNYRTAWIDVAANVAKIFGLPVTNIIRDGKAIAGTIINESNNYAVQYFYDKTFYNMGYSTNRKRFFDNAYAAYKNNPEQYEIIYDDMIKEDAFKNDDTGTTTADAIANAMESRMKDEEGVNSVYKLSKRFLAPEAQREYDALSETIADGDAAEEQKAPLYDELFAVKRGDTQTGKDKARNIETFISYGYTEEEYWRVRAIIAQYDKPTKDAKTGEYTVYGGYVRDELGNGISKATKDNEERALMWYSIKHKYGESERLTGVEDNPWRRYLPDELIP